MDYFFNRVVEIAKFDYITNQQDILCARVMATDIVKQTFEIENKIFVMYDAVANLHYTLSIDIDLI